MSDHPMTLRFLTGHESPPPTDPARWAGRGDQFRREPPRRVSLWEMARLAWNRHRSRLRLAELDAHILKDIGITYAEAEYEANKPFWSA
ncbi:MAG: DUF1127 domain-containing protein [Pseudomonadota bacterium]|nr:DUF1127 domain-containing protein [Pseudomonadota bacterium]